MDEQTAKDTAAQLARPTGEGGISITAAMNEANALITSRVIDAISPVSGEAVAEVGPGNGKLSRDMVASLGARGRYLGFEYNEDMAAIARSTFEGCEAAIEVRGGDFLGHPPVESSIDAFMGVNVLYFFEDLHAFAGRCAEWLRPGGRLALGVRSMPCLAEIPFTEHGFNLRCLDELFIALHSSGFRSSRAEYFDEGSTQLGDDTIAVDAIIVTAVRA